MSAFAYINIEDVPANLRETSVERQDEINTDTTLIAFDGCPLVGEVWKHRLDPTREPTVDVIYPFPRNPQIRGDLVAWFMNWGIHFRVVM